MFQDFDERSQTAASARRIAALRALLGEAGLTGFLLPHADEYQNEYLPPSAERLAWATAFTGSAGFAVVLKERAVLFVDGRYTLQARDQVDPAVFEVVAWAETSPEAWLEGGLTADDRIGFDPRVFTITAKRRLEKAVAKAGATLVALERNPVDEVWKDRPEEPLAPVSIRNEDLAGESTASKLKRLGESLGKDGADALVLAGPTAVAWAFNIRGADVAHTPLPLSHGIVRREGKPTLAIDGRKLSNTVRAALNENVEIIEPSSLEEELGRLSGRKVRVDPNHTSAFIAERLRAAGALLDEGADPSIRLRAVKNAAEIAGTRAAHARDGAALIRFLAWLDQEGPTGRIDEIAAVEALERFRAETGALKDISFTTIAGYGPNGAIVHYHVTRRTNRKIEPGSLFLIDSGAQYEDGTTDVTRTVAIGEPTSDMRRTFTLVLKGHIAIATARFPQGTTGAHLDGFARAALWRSGFDYDHGTGHGVGAYLSVHEGPQGISRLNHAVLEAGMIVSNEPGYYRTDAYGIRIENLLLIHPAQAIAGGEREMLGFETLTFAPIDRRLIVPELLTGEERAWIDLYHTRVRAELEGSLKAASDRAWLAAATAPL